MRAHGYECNTFDAQRRNALVDGIEGILWNIGISAEDIIIEPQAITYLHKLATVSPSAK